MVWFYVFSHTCNIGHVNYRLQCIYYNTTYNISTATQYNVINNNTKFKGQLEVQSATTFIYIYIYIYTQCIYIYIYVCVCVYLYIYTYELRIQSKNNKIECYWVTLRCGWGTVLLVGWSGDRFPVVSLDFSVTYSFQPYHGPGVDSAPSENEYQEKFPGGKCGRYVRLTTSPPSCGECHEIWEPKTPGTLWAIAGLLRDCFSFIEFCYMKDCLFFKMITLSQELYWNSK